MHSAQGFGSQLVPELVVVTKMPGIEADSARLRRALEPWRALQCTMLRRERFEIRELRCGPNLRRVLPVFQLRPRFRPTLATKRLSAIPTGRESRIRETFGLCQGDGAVKDFGPVAVGPVEDLLVNFPSWLGDVRPPFSELRVLQVVVRLIFLPKRCCSRSVFPDPRP